MLLLNDFDGLARKNNKRDDIWAPVFYTEAEKKKHSKKYAKRYVVIHVNGHNNSRGIGWHLVCRTVYDIFSLADLCVAHTISITFQMCPKKWTSFLGQQHAEKKNPVEMRQFVAWVMYHQKTQFNEICLMKICIIAKCKPYIIETWSGVIVTGI